MTKDIIKSFDEAIEKQEELAKSLELTEEVVAEEAVVEEPTVTIEEVVEEATKSLEEVSKSDDKEEDKENEDEDKEDEEADEEEVEKSEETEEEEEAVKAEEPTEETQEEVTKSDTYEEILSSVIKSYTQLAQQVSTIIGGIAEITAKQEEISKSLAEFSIMNIGEATEKSIIAEPIEEVEEKAVGYVEKSFTDETIEEASKSVDVSNTVSEVQAPTFEEVREVFKGKFSTATKSIKSASDEHRLSELQKSWSRLENGYATTQDVERLNKFINE